MSRFLECGVLLRTYSMFASALYAVVGLTQDETLLYKVAHANDFATNTLVALMVFAVLGTIDLIVNDLLPERFVIRRALRDRHLVSMGVALCFGVQAWTCIRYSLPLSPIPFYLQYILLVPASAFADVNKRYKTKRACP